MKQWNNWAEKEVFETPVELRDSVKDPLEIVWCPSHCGVDGNETADKAADVCHLPQAKLEVPFDSAENVIKRKPKWRSSPAHDTDAVYLDNDGAKKYPKRQEFHPPRTNDNLQIKKWPSPRAKSLQS